MNTNMKRLVASLLFIYLGFIILLNRFPHIVLPFLIHSFSCILHSFSSSIFLALDESTFRGKGDAVHLNVKLPKQ